MSKRVKMSKEASEAMERAGLSTEGAPRVVALAANLAALCRDGAVEVEVALSEWPEGFVTCDEGYPRKPSVSSNIWALRTPEPWAGAAMAWARHIANANQVDLCVSGRFHMPGSVMGHLLREGAEQRIRWRHLGGKWRDLEVPTGEACAGWWMTSARRRVA